MMHNEEKLTALQKEILKQEIDLIDKTIARIDHILISLKSTVVLIWGGSLYMIAEHLKEYQRDKLVLLTVVIPLLFWYLDVIWKKQILKLGCREQRIADFINDMPVDDFRILDPLASGYQSTSHFKKTTGLYPALVYKEKGVFYFLLIIISIILGIWIS